MITTAKWLGLLAVAFVAGSFAASPELRAYAANTIASGDIIDGEVKTADLASNAVTASKIKDGEVKAAEIATDAVGAAELQGVTKLLFAKCDLTDGESSGNVIAGGGIDIGCSIPGVTSSDQAIATFNQGYSCFAIAGAKLVSGSVNVSIQNVCNTAINPGDNSFISLIVYRK